MQGSIALCLHYKVTEDFVRFELARVVKMTSRQNNKTIIVDILPSIPSPINHPP